ncbi:MAG: hypothetical protein J5778_06345 [Clostridiales bacterium]|nr:hypothetical protein [Clostridiales bacterium]
MNKKKTLIYMIVSAVLVIIYLLIGIENIVAEHIGVIVTIPVVAFLATTLGYMVSWLVNKLTASDKTRLVLPLVCFAVFIASLIWGFIDLYQNRHEILGDLGAGMIWFFITIPSFAAGLFHGIVSVVKKVKSLKAQQKTQARSALDEQN